jgi:hypothetical protein
MITPNKTIKEIVKELLVDIMVDPELSASKFIEKYWSKYEQGYQSNQNINGKVFEELIAISLIRSGVFPFYMQAKVAFIPNVNYDFIVYTNNLGPISLSVKTSLRERYKQADLEAVAIKYIHRNSKSYVITLNKHECQLRRNNMMSVMGINDFVLATSNEYDELLNNIKENQLAIAPSVEVISSKIVVTAENYLSRYL